MATIEDFNNIEIRVGTIINAKEFPEAKTPAYRLLIDLGEIGTKQSSAQITDKYKLDDLVGKQVVCVCNLPSRRIANFDSEVLVTGFTEEDGSVILAVPDDEVENGLKLT
jgi:tRNA-binding protein